MKGRVIQENKASYMVSGEGREMTAVVRGRFHASKDFPKVGDYVEYTETGSHEAVIESIYPRTSVIARSSTSRSKRDGGVSQEILVANVDILFIVMGLDQDFNADRAERYAALAQQSQVRPVVLLNKCDTIEDPAVFIEKIKSRMPGTPVHAISAKSGINMGAVLGYFRPEITAVLLGSSGAGKSTITNWLLQHDAQETGGVREDDSRGRHTTTARELFTLPSGGYLIDTPGMRELGLSGEADGAFAEIESLEKKCQYSDCDHEKSDGCAIRAAIAGGTIAQEQFENFLKLRREREYAESKADEEAALRYNQGRKKTAKKIHKELNARYRARDAE